MTTVRPVVLAAACAASLLLGACARQGEEQMSWARSALERNPALQIVSADAQAHTFTVRVKDTGEVRTMRADEVVAGPAAPAVAAAAPAPPPVAAAAAPEPAVPASAEAAPAPVPPEEHMLGQPYNSASASSATPKASGGRVLESGPGYSIEAAGAPQAQVMQSGPGYSIKASGLPASAPPSGRQLSSRVTSAALEQRREPIVCQGARLLHIDNRNLAFVGDAVTAEDGCEIYITNTHISATGVGVLARNANVHIDNSLIEGDAGSIDASQGAQVYVASSQFRGLSRRLDSASLHDQGGNVWN
ncbi:MAG TPA: hypothetical protein VL994_01570 [Steroidobacteraceae bacterium]|nr:hypothetical protein [Steroidobacteraceae bacterium]